MSPLINFGNILAIITGFLSALFWLERKLIKPELVNKDYPLKFLFILVLFLCGSAVAAILVGFKINILTKNFPLLIAFCLNSVTIFLICLIIFSILIHYMKKIKQKEVK